ncbi:hypothetical protein BKA81DRAFT_355852 [Phyllosticta paracitricarpa]
MKPRDTTAHSKQTTNKPTAVFPSARSPARPHFTCLVPVDPGIRSFAPPLARLLVPRSWFFPPMLFHKMLP